MDKNNKFPSTADLAARRELERQIRREARLMIVLTISAFVFCSCLLLYYSK